MKKDILKVEHLKVSDEPLKKAKEMIRNLLGHKGREKIDRIRQDMQSLMMDYCSVFRYEEGLKKGLVGISSLKMRFNDMVMLNKSLYFNYELMEAIELGHDLAEVIVLSALHRKDSRGAHFRGDFPGRDDRNYLKHTLIFREGEEVRYKPVTITRFQPQARVY